jgi:hypothetical protein
VGLWVLYEVAYNVWIVMVAIIYPQTIMYFSIFKMFPHNANMLTLEQFEKFCEKHNYTMPEEISFAAKMLSTQSRLGTLHAKTVAGIYGSKSSSSEIEMAES